MDAEYWNNRYADSRYYYGEKPNDFLVETAVQIPNGPVLCLAEGEGRNAVYLATLGYRVTAVDQSEAGLAKARRLAATKGVEISTRVADLEEFEVKPESWSGIVSIFAHVPSNVRRKLYADAVRGLRLGGVFILEAYNPAQLAYGTGGPKSLELLMNLADLRQELDGLEFLIARETEREIIEGTGHTGHAAVVQILAIKRRA